MRNTNTVRRQLTTCLLALTPFLLRAESPVAPAVPLAPAPPAAAGAGPKIQFATNTYEFGRVPVGMMVRATFVFTNTGTAPLEVTEVRPGCGCTTAGSWDRHVEPGKTGTIPLQLNTANFGGAVIKTTTVTCNDPAQPTTQLLIKGEIWKPIDVQPGFVVFNPGAAPISNDVRVVRVVNNTADEITIEAPVSSNPAFKPTLKVVKPGKEFEIQVATVPPLAAGTVQGMVTAKTSSTNLPQISLTVMAISQPAVVAIPNQVLLPRGPLSNPTPITVAIRNNGAEPITVTSPSVTPSNITVSVNEIQPGRVYNLGLNFPAGFQLKPGERGELAVKTSHPSTPLITVPILQRAAIPQPLPGTNLPLRVP